MPGQADPWWDELKEEAELPPEPPPRSKTPAVLGLVAALAVSGGLAWWLTQPQQSTFQNSAVTQVQPQAPLVRVAGPQADAEQVRRAYEDFGTVYADGGEAALARFSDSCRESLKADPRILDFCLAFELFADTVRTDAAPGKAEAQRLAMAQAALPAGADADLRIRQVQGIMRSVSGTPEVQTAAAPEAVVPPAVEKAPDVVTARAPQRDLQKVTAPGPVQAKPVKIAAVAKAKPKADPCRLKSTPADRLVCAYPALASQHSQMRRAYEKALAAGADPLTVDAGQAEWRALRNTASTRAELSMLYTQRIRQLEAAAKAPRSEEPPT